MKYKILESFNPLKDRLNEASLRLMEYDIGELHEYVEKFQLINISIPASSSRIIFYDLKSKTKSRKTKYSLIFIPDFSKVSLEKAKQITIPTGECFYHIDQPVGDFGVEIVDLMKKHSISQLNFINFFRHSNFYDWKITILYGSEIKLNSIVLNTFLALGASIKVEKRQQNMILLKNIPLSFQHSIDLYKIK